MQEFTIFQSFNEKLNIWEIWQFLSLLQICIFKLLDRNTFCKTTRRLTYANVHEVIFELAIRSIFQFYLLFLRNSDDCQNCYEFPNIFSITADTSDIFSFPSPVQYFRAFLPHAHLKLRESCKFYRTSFLNLKTRENLLFRFFISYETFEFRKLSGNSRSTSLTWLKFGSRVLNLLYWAIH